MMLRIFVSIMLVTINVNCNDLHNKVICEDDALCIECPDFTMIKISRATYGRSNYVTCPHPRIQTNDCAADSSLSTLQSTCDGQQTCSVGASNSVFGDPCVNTYKYLNVTYSCEKAPKSSQLIVCEDNSKPLQCPENTYIKIYGATYGRTDRVTCPDPRIRTIECSSNTPLSVIKGQCEGQNSCNVESTNTLYGDPCYGTYKYLTVDFLCIAPKTSQLIVCEDNSKPLQCPENTFIKIYGATYGRTDRVTCPDPRIRTIECSSNTPLSVIKGQCEGQNSCNVASTNKLYGDPCYGTYKYLTVDFVCTGKENAGVNKPN